MPKAKQKRKRSFAPAPGSPLGWSYSYYRATLSLDGERFAIVTPDGKNALSHKNACLLLEALNLHDHAEEMHTMGMSGERQRKNAHKSPQERRRSATARITGDLHRPGSASESPRTVAYWNKTEPQCADPSQLAEAMFHFAAELEAEYDHLYSESQRRRRDVLRWFHRWQNLQRKMQNAELTDHRPGDSVQ